MAKTRVITLRSPQRRENHRPRPSLNGPPEELLKIASHCGELLLNCARSSRCLMLPGKNTEPVLRLPPHKWVGLGWGGGTRLFPSPLTPLRERRRELQTNSLRYEFFAEILIAVLRDVAQPGSAHPW